MNTQNIKLLDVPATFSNLPEQGGLRHFNGEPWVPNMAESHVQGIARYGNYILLSHNNKGYSKGFICVLNVTSKRMVYTFDTPDEHFNHPGGMQVIGDYMVVPVENSHHSQSYIHFYDLSAMTDAVRPTLLKYSIHRGSSGAGAVGITNSTANSTEYYLLATYNNGHMDFYRSNGHPLSSPDFGDILFSTKLPNTSYSAINLLTDTKQTIYMLAFRTHDIATSKKDYVDLFQVDLQKQSVTAVTSRHFLNVYGGITGMNGVHFRWGAGLQRFAGEVGFRGGRLCQPAGEKTAEREGAALPVSVKISRGDYARKLAKSRT